jgi:hypothetical protein
VTFSYPVIIKSMTHNKFHERDLTIISQFQYKHKTRTYENFFDQSWNGVWVVYYETITRELKRRTYLGLIFVYYETIKRELNKGLIYECRCEED